MISRVSFSNFIKPSIFKKSLNQPPIQEKTAQTELSGLEHCPSISAKRLSGITKGEILYSIRNSQPISSGFKGTVYSFEKDDKKYAIKVAKGPEFNFSKEADVLKRVKLDKSQQFVDYFKDPVTDDDILVSTFVEGKKGILKSDEDFKTFFDNLIQLDEAEILHNDLNMGNCLFEEDDINLLDFGEGEIFNTGEKYDELYPSFVAKTNAVNLEHNGTPDCIIGWQKEGLNTKENFIKYLQAKGEFYAKHSKILEERCGESAQRMINYERNLAAVLKNPSDAVIENEIRRIDAFYTFEDADTAVNYTKYPSDAIRNWNMAILKTKNMLKRTEEECMNSELPLQEREYFNYQHILAKSMNYTFSKWGKSTIDWINRVMRTSDSKLNEHEKELKKNKDKTNPPVPNLRKIVLGEV